jgi:hypothetical protein
MNTRPKLVSRKESNLRYGAKKKSQGYKQLVVWCPVALLEEVKQFIKMKGAV